MIEARKVACKVARKVACHVLETCCDSNDPMPPTGHKLLPQTVTLPNYCSLYITRRRTFTCASLIISLSLSFFLIILSISFSCQSSLLILTQQQQAGLGPTLFARMQLVVGFSFGTIGKHLLNPLPCFHFRGRPIFPAL